MTRSQHARVEAERRRRLRVREAARAAAAALREKERACVAAAESLGRAVAKAEGYAPSSPRAKLCTRLRARLSHARQQLCVLVKPLEACRDLTAHSSSTDMLTWDLLFDEDRELSVEYDKAARATQKREKAGRNAGGCKTPGNAESTKKEENAKARPRGVVCGSQGTAARLRFAGEEGIASARTHTERHGAATPRGTRIGAGGTTAQGGLCAVFEVAEVGTYKTHAELYTRIGESRSLLASRAARDALVAETERRDRVNARQRRR